MSKKGISFLSALACAACLSIPASATQITVSSGQTSPIAGNTINFSSGMPSNFTVSGPEAGIYTGSLFDVYLAPAGDSTPYFAVGPNSWLNISYASAPITSFGLYWGSIDSYNTIVFTDTTGVKTSFGGNTGTSLSSILPSWLSTDGTASSYVTFTDQGAAWKSVYISSNIPAFEFDNVTTVVASTPEPASIALIATGLVAVGAGALRRRKRQ